MRTSFRDFVKTGKGKLTVALCALGLSWIFLLWNFSGSFGELLPGEERIDALERAGKPPMSSKSATGNSSKATGARSATASSRRSCATRFSRLPVRSS